MECQDRMGTVGLLQVLREDRPLRETSDRADHPHTSMLNRLESLLAMHRHTESSLANSRRFRAVKLYSHFARSYPSHIARLNLFPIAQVHLTLAQSESCIEFHDRLPTHGPFIRIFKLHCKLPISRILRSVVRDFP